MRTWYLVNGVAYDREEVVALAIDLCYLVGPENVRNCLPAHTVEQNCKHHPKRILRELGNNVQIIRK